MSYVGIRRTGATLRKSLLKQDIPEDVRRFRALADRHERKIARAFEASIENVRENLSVTEAADLIESGQVEEVAARYTSDADADFSPLAAAISEAVLDGARLTADLMPPIRKAELVEFVFNPTNPRLTDFAQTLTARRIREISEGTRQTIRQTIRTGTLQGDNPLTTARTVRQSIGLTRRQAQAVENFRSMLQSGSGEALSRVLRDKRFDPTVRRLIEGGTVPQAKINEMVERYRQRYIKYRSETIARTETIRSLGGAQHRLIQDAVERRQIDERQVKRFWHYTQDELTRTEHRMIPAMNPNGRGQNEPFQTPLGPLMFPGDPSGVAANTINCRCVVFTRVIARELIEDLDEPGPTPPPPKPKPRQLRRPETRPEALPPQPIELPPMGGPVASVAEILGGRSLLDAPRLSRAMEGAPESAILDRVGRLRSPRDIIDASDGSYYMSFTKRLHMRGDFRSETPAAKAAYNRTYRHEYGHHIDQELGAETGSFSQFGTPFVSFRAVNALAEDGKELAKARTGPSIRGPKTRSAAMGKFNEKVQERAERLKVDLDEGRFTAPQLIENRGFTLDEVRELYPEQIERGLDGFAVRFAAAVDLKDHNYLIGNAPNWRKPITPPLEGVSDSIEASVAGAFGHWFGHGAGYYRKQLRSYSGQARQTPVKRIGGKSYSDFNTTQAFANWFEAQTGPSAAARKMWRLLLPRTDAAFRKIIEDSNAALGDRL